MRQPTDYEYPDGIDCFWIGSDSIGNVGVFIIAGMAPVPSQVLSAEYGDMLELEEQLLQLPIISEVQHPGEDRSFSDLPELAERGFFIFDWSDIHRARSEKIRGYERMTAPTRPLNVNELDGFLHNCVVLACIPEPDFRRDAIVRLPPSMETIRPERYWDY
jgi:hypothetical protein